ncbi:MAG TPA: hypothetical protein VLB76_24330 [Thermoanaerobaculia bacterium]|jgi:hypothetical protein|nr:hypothetical protein [Thermoanaerobaculia bacterium]
MKSRRAATALGLLFLSTTALFAGTQQATLSQTPGSTTSSYGCYDFTCDGETLAGSACGETEQEIFDAAVAYCKGIVN